MTPGSYKLKASTDGFSKSIPLFLNSKRVSLLIQINKPTFRPDDLVEFRVFVVDSKTKPYEVKTTSTIRILDAGNNQVKVWKDPLFKKGLVEESLQLNDVEPGVWKILVEADGEVRAVKQKREIIFKNFLTDRIQIIRSAERQKSNL